jgi:phage terminase large subunit-like protein
MRLTRADVERRLTGDRGQPITVLSWYARADTALEDAARRAVVLWLMRQSGKTQYAIRRAAGDLLTVPHSYTLVVSAGREQAEVIHDRKLRRPLARLLRAAGLPASTLHMTQTGATNPALDSAVEIVSANEATAPARSVTLLIVDEAKNVSDRLFAALAPSVLAAGGKILCLSTPGPPRGFFHHLATEPDPAVCVIRVSGNENPCADPEAIGFLGRLLAKVLPVARRRDLENVFAEDGERAIPPEVWAACVEPTWSPLWPTPEVPLVLAIDAATKGDTCAAVAVFRDEDQVILAGHQIWTPTAAEPLDLREVEEWGLDLSRRYTLAQVVADPYQMARSIAALRAAGLYVTEFLQTPANLTKMTGLLLDVLQSRSLVLYPSDELAEQAGNAVIEDTTRGYKLAKVKASAKVDAIVALAMAVTTVLEQPVAAEPRLVALGR